ncbi:hypothetical protein FACS1894211_02620 [Clostridia bacterium]|nr:hypothetical protein FACS1894211_02620 [Clostridia bacterium]
MEQLKNDELIDLVAAEMYLMIQAERNDTELARLENLVAENQKAINNLMQVLMQGKIADTVIAQIDKLETENKELKACIEYERAMQTDYGYGDIRKWLLHFRDLDYTEIKNRKYLIDSLVYKVILYDDKMKVIMHLKGGQHKGELLLSLIFPDYPDGDAPPRKRKRNRKRSFYFSRWFDTEHYGGDKRIRTDDLLNAILANVFSECCAYGAKFNTFLWKCQTF